MDPPPAIAVETSLQVVLETAFLSADLEVTCLVMILGHATLSLLHGGLCASALDLLAAKMGYQDRAQYLRFHLQV